MSEILEGLESVLCQIDDILIFGSNQHQHDIRLMAALDWIEKADVTLNPIKWASDPIPGPYHRPKGISPRS